MFMAARVLLIFCTFLFHSHFCLLNSTPKSQEDLIDIFHYKIDLQFDWTLKKAIGSVDISFAFTQDAKVIQLSADNLVIHSITDAFQKSIPFTVDTSQRAVFITFDKIQVHGTRMEIKISYETKYINESDPSLLGGSFGKGIRFFRPTKVNPIKRKQIWSQSELTNASYWFPCSIDISDLSTTECSAKVDKGLTFISNGTLIKKTTNPDSTNTFYYKTDKAHPVYLTAFVVGEYTEIKQEYNGVPLLTYCYPDERNAAIATVERLPDMMRFLNEQTAFNYPFSHYAQVMVQDYPFPSLTGQHTFGIISDNMIDDYGTHKDFLYLWDGVEFNALASQWFGNVIIPKNVEDIWLSKSLAQYFEGRYAEERHGEGEYLLWYHPWESGSVFNDWNNGNRHAIVPEKIHDAENFAGDSYAKYKGALILRMLRQELGSDIFIKCIQHFIKVNAFQPVTTKDFEKAILQVSGKDMNWFFEQWIYNAGHPIFNIKKSYDAETKELRFYIQQTQSQDTAETHDRLIYFQGRVSIAIDDKIEFVWLEPKPENTFLFHSNRCPESVHFDVGNIWFKEVKFEKTFDENLKGFLNSKDIAHKNEAMINLIDIAKNAETNGVDKAKILSAFIKEIQSNTYWRFRFNLLNQLRTIQQPPYDNETLYAIKKIINNEKSWIKAAALTHLGMTNDSFYADIYISCLNDVSDRVVNSAAIALGKSKSSKAYKHLLQLQNRPSWKNQSLMHMLNGLAPLNHQNTELHAIQALRDNTSPRWFLGNGWDYPYVAAQTLNKIGRTDEAHTIVYNRLQQALTEKNIDDIFHQVLLVSVLGNPKGKEVFTLLKSKYSGESNILNAILLYEEQFNSALPKK